MFRKLLKHMVLPSFSSDERERAYQITIAKNMCDCYRDPPTAESLAAMAKINMLVMQSITDH